MQDPSQRRFFPPAFFHPVAICLAFCLAALLPAAAPVAAQDDGSAGDDLGWTRKAELSFVATAGNAESSSLGFGATFVREWEDRQWKLELGGLRAESTTTDRRAIRGIDGVQIVEDESTELTAENYSVTTRYDNDFRDEWFWHVGGGWEQDEFAGIDRRVNAVAGVGHHLWDRDDGHFKVDAGATWTEERLAVGGEESFAGLRLSSDWASQVTETTELTHHLVVNQNLDATDDLRAQTNFAVHVAISHRLAIKAALDVKYDAEPALEELEIEGMSGETVLVPLEETDTKLTVSLVLSF